MATPDEMAATMLRNLPGKTGKSLSDWHKILKLSSLEKHGEMVKLLKTDHGVTHGFANLIVAKYRDTGTQTADGLVGAQYAGTKADLRPIYEALVDAVSGFGPDVEFAPKKAYVSLRRNKQFGLIQPSTKTRIDIGLNLGDAETTKRLEKSGSFNAMVTHRVRLESVDDVDKQVIAYLKKAYEGAK